MRSYEYDDDEYEYREPYDGDCKMGTGSDGEAIIGGAIGFVCWLAVMATLGMAFLKVAAWAWA